MLLLINASKAPGIIVCQMTGAFVFSAQSQF